MLTVIMAGGKGTRISSVISNVPKPMIPVDGKPVLEREILSLRDQGFMDIIISISHLGEIITDYFGDGSRLGVHIEYYKEKKPLGNAGALFKIRNDFGSEPFLLINGDAVFDVDFNRFLRFHQGKGAEVSLLTHPNSHPYDSGIIIADENDAVINWLTKEDVRPEWYQNCVNAGLHIIDPVILDRSGINPDEIGKEINGSYITADLDRNLLKPLCGTGTMFSYNSPEYVKDMGTPDRLNSVIKDLNSGVVEAKSLRHKQKAVFLDRDGTINQYVGFLRDINEFELLPGVAEAIRTINKSGYLAIVVTNQPVIARGEVTIEQLKLIHNKMETLLGKEGAYLDAVYFCPHHPHKGYEGEVQELKVECDCRKPKPGMLLRAKEDYNIDLENSWMVGDGKNDIIAGQSAGCHTALIGSKNYGQEATCHSLLEFVTSVL